MKPRVLFLARDRLSSRMVFHGLSGGCSVAGVVLETTSPWGSMLRRRIKRLGWRRTAGQMLFLGANRFLALGDRGRRAELMRRYGLSGAPISDSVLRVKSVNEEAVIRRIQEVQPDVVVINGTRIVSSRVLGATRAPFINVHLGITPRYRGIHGGYWALVNRDRNHCGVTVHLVDEGVDTGGILYQTTVEVGPGDSINTYPLHQLGAALPLLRRALADAARGALNPLPATGPSRLWYHPTLYEYWKHRIVSGVK